MKNVFTPYGACLHSKGYMLMVSSSGMPVSLKTDLRFPITGQQGHGSRNIHTGAGQRPRHGAGWLSGHWQAYRLSHPA